mmetsp:Transcript_48938/g.147427  ORF Transcript_48938/g.147427 Transcript_48938/m.147427 type:complete len:88 (-) Transcript_48938:1280-1543(-)
MIIYVIKRAQPKIQEQPNMLMQNNHMDLAVLFETSRMASKSPRKSVTSPLNTSHTVSKQGRSRMLFDQPVERRFEIDFDHDWSILGL